jgi:hypothetical protein
MPGKPIYPNHLDPTAWEKNKGTLAKATVKADVKGTLEKASKSYWEGVSWEAFDDLAAQDDIKGYVAQVDKLNGLVATVESASSQGIREIDKVPANKLLMKKSRDYLVQMEKDSKAFQDTLKSFIAKAQAEWRSAKAVEKRADTFFEGHLKDEEKRAKELVSDCEAYTKAAMKPMSSGTGAKEHAIERADQSLKELKDLFVAVEHKYNQLDPTLQSAAQKSYTSFKAQRAACLAAVLAAKRKLAAAEGEDEETEGEGAED